MMDIVEFNKRLCEIERRVVDAYHSLKKFPKFTSGSDRQATAVISVFLDDEGDPYTSREYDITSYPMMFCDGNDHSCDLFHGVDGLGVCYLMHDLIHHEWGADNPRLDIERIQEVTHVWLDFEIKENLVLW